MVATLLSEPPLPQTCALQAVWRSLTPQSCPYQYNFHLHTQCSDGQMAPENLLQQAVDLGLRGLAITDHHSVQGYGRARAYLKDLYRQNPQTPLPDLWTGVEITSDLFGTEVHILGYGFDPEAPTLRPYLRGERPLGEQGMAAQVINALHQAGGLAVLAHPARYRQPASRLIPQAAQLGIDGAEAYYAYGNPKPWVSSPPQMEEVLYLSQVYNLASTCGTDSHGESILFRV
ncbi:MAG: PHP domain-containing protein [Cyanobacteriota bacterium]|jgi:predicted metal-dependent phosphoesterase TrpH